MRATARDPGVGIGGRARRHAPPRLVAPCAPDGRYRIREVDGVRFLSCVESPGLRVRIEPGATVTAQEARQAPPGSIFLDGAAAGPPFADAARRVYNLDHHEGCVRAFTLSACEQAMVLVRKGLDLRSREWTVHANDADLDAVLAIWVLTNHLRLADPNDPVRREIMPLLRLEGAIDAQGLELADLCALPPDLLGETSRRMDALRERERQLRSGAEWKRLDLLEYVRERLEQIDRLVYPAAVLEEFVEIEELGRTELANGSIAIACRGSVGIYEIERELRRLHGPRLGLVVLENRSGGFTLRQVDPSLPGDLETVYAHLNFLDARAGSARSGDRWGGSSEIGGSPRRSGSRLSSGQVLEVCRHALTGPTPARRLAALARAIALAGVVLLVARGIAAGLALRLGLAPEPALGYALAATAGSAFGWVALRRPCVVGLRAPRGTAWLRTVPLAVASGLLAGPGLAGASVGASSPLLELRACLAWLAAIAGSELLFRGLIQGQLAWAFGPRAEASGVGRAGPGPAVLTAGLSAAAAVGLGGLEPVLAPAAPALVRGLIVLVGAFGLGLALGHARTRSESVLPPILVHAIAAATCALAPFVVPLLEQASRGPG